MRSAKSFWTSYVNKGKKSRKKGIFGGEIKSVDEVKELSDKIKKHEEREAEIADAELEKHLKNL